SRMTRNLAEEMTRALTELHLSTMQAQYEEVSRQATAETWGYADYLLELTQRECQQRRERRSENVLMFGPPGSGKTHCLSAVSQELLVQFNDLAHVVEIVNDPVGGDRLAR